MFDIFYLEKPTGLFSGERFARDVEHARSLSRTRYFWIVHYLSDYDQWDWNWEPPPWESHFRHAWPDQYHIDSGTYLIPTSGYTDTKYHLAPVVHRLPDINCWYIPPWIDHSSIDWRWSPDPLSPPYVYEFPVEWGWDHIGGPEYRVPGAQEKKYIYDFVAKTLPDADNLEVMDLVDANDPIFRWRPNPKDPPYIYVFGNQWWPAEKRTSARYSVSGAQNVKYVTSTFCHRLVSDTNWNILIDDIDIDQSWEPDPGDPPYIYVFGNQWWSAETMPTAEYHVPGATERKYMDHPRARLPAKTDDRWSILHQCEWDYSWVPDPGDPPYIYVFGNQWHSAETMPTAEYHVSGATEQKFMEYPRAQLPADPSCWTIPDDVDASAIDYSWVPDPGSPPYIYHFGTQHQASVGVIYTVPGATEIKFAGDIPTTDKTRSALVEPDVFYLDFSNPLSAERFARIQKIIPKAQRVRYVNNLLDTISRCAKKSTTHSFWVISSQNDYSDFDFSWHPEIWQRGMIHVFGTQWSKWSDTFLINRWEFDRQVNWQNRLEDFYNLNFVSNQVVTASTDAADIIVIDHNNIEKDSVMRELQRRPGRIVRAARYFDNYLDTFKRCIDDSVISRHVWICSTLCDYSKFDFSWQPEVWQRDMIHVFASEDNKFGDTFLVPVDAWRDQQSGLELLDWFDTVNYVPEISVPRWPMPVIQHRQDTHVDVAKQAQFSGPLVLLSVAEELPQKIPIISLWREKTRTVTPLDPGAASVIVPRSAIPYIKTQFYDYPHIDKTQRHRDSGDPLDIVFISNGEPNARENWERLLIHTQGIPNRCVRVDGITGRVAAYHAAAEASDTAWFFAVFAKLEVLDDFDWSWQPDRMQQPKHYIFHALNPVNGLVYGHQAMISYNRSLVLGNPGVGLDFTLDSAHETVPMMSGVARYNTSAWSTWRTAFREVIKLRHSLPDVENKYRLDQWTTQAQGDFGEWSQWGALDALEYYDEVLGDLDQLRRSYEWAWLASYAFVRRNLTPDQ